MLGLKDSPLSQLSVAGVNFLKREFEIYPTFDALLVGAH